MKKYILPMILFGLLLMPTALASDVKINDFSSNVTNGTIPIYTRFTGDVTGNVTNWLWEFHNIETGVTTYSSSHPSTHHNFKKPGIYDVTLKVWGPDGNDTLTKSSYINAAAVSTETKARSETTPSVSSHMNPKWGPKDKKRYSNGYDEGYHIGLINGFNRGYYLGTKGLKYAGTGRSDYKAKSTTSQDIGYADGYNVGYDMKFLSGYDAGYSIIQAETFEIRLKIFSGNETVINPLPH